MDDESADQQILQRMGEWLREFRAHSLPIGRNGQAIEQPRSAAAESEVGLYQLVEAFTTLRHEVNLQTRGSRGLEDQAKSLLPALQQATEALRSVEPQEAQAAWNAGKSLALALAELDEALARASEQTDRAVARWLAEPANELLARLDETQARQSWLGRLLHGRYFQRLRNQLAITRPRGERQAALEAVQSGYRLIHRRLAQNMKAAGITRIRAVGEPVDPEQMIVVEVIQSDSLPAETVCEEIRAGYLWKGRLLRSAEVRATRGPAVDGAPTW
jgi:molecular chaperone GrpE